MKFRVGRSAIARCFLAACCLAAAAQAQAPGDVRIALVIGNGAYPGPAALPNPVNDAKAMSSTLRGLGFEVIEVRDADRAQMLEAVQKVRGQLQGKQGIGMLYYAGHGLQVDWRNYMVPVDAALQASADVPAQTVEIGTVIESFKTAGNRMNILVLDACRDNPFPQVTSAKGLAQLDAPPGTILAYATAPGNVADDGPGANGLYTGFLLQELVKPQSRIEDVFKRTRFAVRKASQGRQIPWESTSLEDDFMFNGGKVAAVPKADDRQREQIFNQEKADWERIAGSSNVDDFFGFVSKYPSGSYIELAQVRIERLQKPLVVAQPAQGEKPQQSFLTRYRENDKYTFQFKDGLTGVVRTVNATVRRIGEDEFEMAGQGMPSTRTNSAGMVLQDGAGTFDPPWTSVPGYELQVGRKAKGRSVFTPLRGQKMWADYEAKVVARETLDTPLGRLDTYRVEVNFQFENGNRRELVLWFDPDWGGAVRQTVRFSLARGGAPNLFQRDMVARSRTTG